MCGNSIDECLNCKYDECVFPEGHIFPWEMAISKEVEHQAHNTKMVKEEKIERRREAKREWYWKDPEARRAYSRAYYQAHKEHLVQLHIEWKKRNPDKVKAYSQIYEKERRKRNKDAKRREIYTENEGGMGSNSLIAKEG